MNTETLQITKEAAIKAHEAAKPSVKKTLEDLFGKKVFLKDIAGRIKCFDDVLEDLGIDKNDFQKSCEGLEPDEVAYKKIKLIAKCFNEGWVPDWTDGQWNKYFPWFKMGSSSGVGFSYHGCDYWSAVSDAGSRLCFKTAALAKYAGETFTEIYKEFMILK